MRYRLTVEYQGTRYHGWQGQQNARTVQGELLRAGRELFGAEVDVQGSGRTDAGVHALGQVAHLEAPRSLAAGRLVAGFNDLLPPDINLLAAAAADPGFHARHDAAGRSYLYQLSRRRTAFGKPFVWWIRDPLDAKAIAATGRVFEGMHDFRSYCDADPAEGSTRVKLDRVQVEEAGDLVLVRVLGSHFLWKMVRRLVGVMAEVGRGNLRPADAELFLREPSEVPARLTAPPSGLFLELVLYEGDEPPGPLRPVLNL